MKSNIPKMYVIGAVKNMMFFGAVTVPFFLDWARLDYTRMFLLEASFSFWMFALEIPTGVVADRYGRKYSLALGGLFTGASFAIFGLVNDIFAFFVAEFVCALGMTLLSGADRAMIYDTLLALGREDSATKCFSRYESAGLAGIIIGLLGGSALAGMDPPGYPAALPLTFIITGIALAFIFIIALTLTEPEREKAGGGFLRQGIDGFRYIFTNRVLRAFSLNYSFISAATFFIYWLYQTLLMQSGVAVSWFGAVGAAFNVAGIALMLNVARIEKALGIERLIFATAVVPGLLYMGLCFIPNIAYVLAAIVLIASLRQLRVPLLSDFMNRHIESGVRATVLSGVSMLERVVIMFMYPVTGLIADVSPEWAFLFLGCVTVLFSFIVRVETDAFHAPGTAS